MNPWHPLGVDPTSLQMYHTHLSNRTAIYNIGGWCDFGSLIGVAVWAGGAN